MHSKLNALWLLTCLALAGCGLDDESISAESGLAGELSLMSASVPKNASENDPAGVEVGVKFRSDVTGTITAIRFYKGASNKGTHIGNLWSTGGARLATVTFSSETASGWQEARLAKPVALMANTLYVVSYFAPQGMYAADENYFLSKSLDAAPLHAPESAAVSGNGVYRYGSSSGFPSSSYHSTNYWVDVRFVPTPVAHDAGVVTHDAGVTPKPDAGTSPIDAGTVTPPHLTLAWDASSTSGVTYSLLRGEHTGGPYTQIASGLQTTTFTDTNVTTGTTYFYVSVAVNAAGTSVDSNEASAAP